MKKIFSILAFTALLAGVFSCETYKVGEPGMTAIHQIDGKYMGFAFDAANPADTVSVYAVTITNTTDDEADRAWVTVIDMDTEGVSWTRLFSVRFPVHVDIDAQTFTATDVDVIEPRTAWNPYVEGRYGSYGSFTTAGYQWGATSKSATISGKVVTDGIDTATGYKADALEFDYTLVYLDGTEKSIVFKGMKKTGWAEDAQEYQDYCDKYLR